MPENVFELLVKPLRDLLAQRGFEQPTLPQVHAIPPILEGKNVLLIAPTGTGKTEAGLLAIFNKILSSPRSRGIKLIYITPLRALNRDMLDRIEWWCRALDLRISVRHGDTSIRERRKQALSPPDILITTPETLQVVLLSKRLGQFLSAVQWVVVDEIHELADNKRGSQLSLNLERLRQTKGGDFQLIGLSATIGSPEEVGKFLVGQGRECQVIDTTMERKAEIKVLYPVPEKRDVTLASKLYTYPQVTARLRVIRQMVEKYNSTLIFTNTRPMAEILASRLRMWELDFPVSVHHGSLSSFSRTTAEKGLKEGKLKGVVATSSLELGLDIGRVDFCIQYNSPHQVTRLLQRVGRSGHRVGGTARGAILAQDPDDALESVVIAARSEHRDLERVSIPEKPMDVLAHGLVGELINSRRCRVADVYEWVRRAYPFRDLSKEELLDVLNYLQSLERRLAWVSPEGDIFARPGRQEHLFDYYFRNLSMIPQLRQYLVVDDTKGEPVGILDDSFVAEYGEPGTKFVIGGSIWRIIQVFRGKVYVEPDDDPLGAIPSWTGEEIPVPYSIAQEVGQLKEQVEILAGQGSSIQEISRKLAQAYQVDPETMERAIGDCYEQLKLKLPLPTHRRLTIEKDGELHVLQAHFGTLINRTLARLIAHLASEELGETVGISVGPYRIILKSKSLMPEDVVAIIKERTEEDFRDSIRSVIEESRFFKWRLAQVARRMGVLSAEAELSGSLMNKLLRALRDTPPFKEAFREVAEKDLDLKGTLKVLEDLKAGRLELVSLGILEKPTPTSGLGRYKQALALEPVSAGRLRILSIASARVRLLNEVRTFACTKCRRYVEELRINQLKEKPKCPLCGSTSIGMVEETLSEVERVLESPAREVSKIWKGILDTANLISIYGKPAAVALAGRGVTPSMAAEVLAKEDRLSSKFFEQVMEKEKEALFRKFKLKKLSTE